MARRAPLQYEAFSFRPKVAPDLLALAPEGSVLALEVKGTLRPGAIPGFAAHANR